MSEGKLIEVHGTMDKGYCQVCRETVTKDAMKSKV